MGLWICAKAGWRLEALAKVLLATLGMDGVSGRVILWITRGSFFDHKVSPETFPHTNRESGDNSRNDSFFEILDLPGELRLDGQIFADFAAAVHDGRVVTVAEFDANLR